MKEKLGGVPHGPMETRVWLRLLTCARLIEKKIRRNFAEQFGTTLPRFDVMACLERHPEGRTMGELSRALLVSNGNVTSIVKYLQHQGLVVSRPDPADRRTAIVALSPAGREAFNGLAQAHHDTIRAALGHFPREEQKMLYEILDRLKHSIERDVA